MTQKALGAAPTAPEDLVTKLYADTLTPSGVIQLYGGVGAPTGWLVCDGRTVSRTTYAALFSAIAMNFTGTVTTGSANITNVTVTSGASVLTYGVPGWPISGPGIPAGATITAISGTTVTISVNATATNASASVWVAPWGIGNGTSTFNLPDLRSTFIFGGDGQGVATPPNGSTGGGVQHYHTLSAAGQAAIMVTGNNGGVLIKSTSNAGVSGADFLGTVSGWTRSANPTQTTANSAQLQGTTDNASSLPPYTVVTHVIKT